MIRYMTLEGQAEAPNPAPTQEQIWAAVQVLSNPIFDASVSDALAAQVLEKGAEGKAALDRALATLELSFHVLEDEEVQ